MSAVIGWSAPALGASSQVPRCDTPGHRQFDFWVGRWDVYQSGTNKLVAHSIVEKVYRGCAVRENWMPLSGNPGGSLNSFRRKTGDWRQVWTDSANELHEYSGRWVGKMLRMEGTAADARDKVTRVRMTFAPLRDGSVVQTGYAWRVKSKAWALQYTLIYRRRRGA